MELNLRTVLVILGALVMLGILLDGFRRMRRARQEALKLDVKGDFKFPEESFSAELPNGGARVIGERDSDELLEDTQIFREQLHEIPGISALDQLEEDDLHKLQPDIQESLHEERIYAGEPDFQHESYETVAENIFENFTVNDSAAQQEDVVSTDIGDNKFETNELETNELEINESSVDEKAAPTINNENISASEHLIPKAKPLNLDEHVPLLMDVEELGEELEPQPITSFEEASVDRSTINVTEEFSNTDSGVSSEGDLEENIELTADDISGIEASVAGISDILAPEVSAPVLSEENENVASGRQEAEDMMAIAAYTPVKKPGPNAEILAQRQIPNLVVVTHVVPHDEDGFCGEDILYLVNSCDLRHGEKDIFHRFEKENGEGRIQFSMANSFNPGTFDPKTLLHERVHGVSLFMSLPGPDKAMDAFEAMTEMASVIARNLGGDVHDETHSIMALQTIEHNRQQVRDFVRKQKLMGKK